MLRTLLVQGFSFQSFEEFLINPNERGIVLRHDVDRLPENSLKTAQLEASLGIRGSYYFRMVPCSYNEAIIRAIARLGHEVGYHYETMDSARLKDKSIGLEDKSKKLKDKRIEKEEGSEWHIDVAYVEFCENLELLRKIVPVTTICMHGSPRSQFDNRDIWKSYDYRKLGIVGEPYFDVDFNKVFYLTDTGRRWNGHRFSVRDKMPQQEQWNREGLNFRTTSHIIRAAESGKLPNQIMITIHPQRWNNGLLPWIKELVLQNIKNVVKWGVIWVRNGRRRKQEKANG